MGISAEPLDLAKIRRNQRRLKGLLSNPEVPNDHVTLQHFPVSVGKSANTGEQANTVLDFGSETSFYSFPD